MVANLHEGRPIHEQFPHIFWILLANWRIEYCLFQDLQTQNTKSFIDYGDDPNIHETI